MFFQVNGLKRASKYSYDPLILEFKDHSTAISVLLLIHYTAKTRDVFFELKKILKTFFTSGDLKS